MHTGYELTFSDFRRLLSDADYRPEVAPLLRAWFECETIPVGDGFLLRDSSGAELDPNAVYDAIQADRERQYSLYQTAMSLWR